MAIVLGIDGGGSKTVALLADAQGHILGRGVAGPSNYQAVGAQAALDALEQAAVAALAGSGQRMDSIQALCLGLAGVDRPEDRGLFERWAAQVMPAARLLVVNDAELLLAAGTPAGWGVAVIAGTGSIVVGRHPQGQTTRAGGWGYLLGDEGSGYAIGLAALQAVARAADGRSPATRLTQAILEAWGLKAPGDLIPRVYQGQTGRTDIARLASLVEAVAGEGDEVAWEILRHAGRELALAVAAVTRRLGLAGPVPCAQGGGLLVKGRLVPALFLEAAGALGLQLEPVSVVPEPAQGAVRLAVSLLKP